MSVMYTLTHSDSYRCRAENELGDAVVSVGGPHVIFNHANARQLKISMHDSVYIKIPVLRVQFFVCKLQ